MSEKAHVLISIGQYENIKAYADTPKEEIRRLIEIQTFVREEQKKGKYVYEHISGINWRTRDGKREYEQDDNWVSSTKQDKEK